MFRVICMVYACSDAQLCPTLCSVGVAHQAPLSIGFYRQEVVISLSRYVAYTHLLLCISNRSERKLSLTMAIYSIALSTN